MRVADLQYDLPPERIAQEPAAAREDARLLVVPRTGGGPTHRTVADLPALVNPGDLIVVNDTKVLQARVHGLRSTGGRVEVFFLEPSREAGRWWALLRSGGRPQPGEHIAVGDAVIALRAREPGGRFEVEVQGTSPEALMEAHGRMPLPPYIARAGEDARQAMDATRYQTVFANERGAVAAPTAGLHWTPSLLEACRARGARVESLTLHVGLGTFEPVRTDDLDDHAMHEERYSISESLAEAVASTRARGGRVLATGTTCVRALESAVGSDGRLAVGDARTRLLIQPGYTFGVVDGLLTNFHLPGSTLLALVSAFAGFPRVLELYRQAIVSEYRFFSYGDAMWIA